MALIRKNELKNLSDEDIESKISELRLELAKERGKIRIGSFPENPGRVRELRRTIARILTIKNQRRYKKTQNE